ncbi:alpha-1,3-mannosyl-glycoprotein 4-beta-N-acetylglucosaminyltransferase-like protein MGAT4E [Cynocephalus volans]|uniref:alpha-1,3-mannosyl-glycoprotein 4-beta-N-acetylglucosaminyltransferase-like protein MGAT4E n=1 Tax=Cynocephalus volans TaxID=110931 RepID=UPI002FC84E2B
MSPPELLTVGISVWRPHGTYLLDTLRSLFQASSEPELKYLVVLLHLADPDPKWLGQTVANISGLFAPQIEAGNLLVALGLLSGSPLPGDLKNMSHSSPCEGLYSRQKAGYALLMHLASTLSDYFLLMEDNVRCTPKFVTAIYSALSAWKELPWAMLEFSSLRFSGKVFHTSDLSHLASFLLLFQNTPTDLLLSSFGLLLGQTVPVSLAPNLFHSWNNFSTSEDKCYEEAKEEEGKENLGEPDNPPAEIYTNMMVRSHHLPEHAYSQNESHFQTHLSPPGSTYTLVLNQSHSVTQIQVLTGLGKQGIYHLQHGQVELGYEPLLEKKVCARYMLLGPLVKGELHQKVYYEEDFVEAVRCVRLLVTDYQESSVCIRQINIWVKPEKG